MVNEYCRTGLYFKSPEHREGKLASTNSLNGILSYIYYIKQDRTKPVDNSYCEYEDMKGIQKLYTKFLFHYNFIYSYKTTIIGEGFTDPRHLKIAYKSISNNSRDGMKFTYLGNTKRFSHFMGLNGGTGLLSKFLKSHKLLDKSASISRQPCIIVLDGDKAGSDVIKQARNLYSNDFKKIGIPNIEIMNFYHVYNNLYLLQLDEGADIEELYDSSIRQIKIGERTYKPSNKKTDQSKYYGKREFLEKVVEPNRSTIDFSNFEIIFKTLSYIQLYHLIFYISNTKN